MLITKGLEPFDVVRPEDWRTPVVFASPHSGCDYPDAFVAASRLDAVSLRRSEDAFVDEIFASAPRLGAPLLKANFPRAYIDPNREPYELDPDMFQGPLPDYVNTLSPRVSAGLGTIARVVTNGENIYLGKLDFQEAKQAIESLYLPYHAALEELITETATRFGGCLLIDCHSMPSVGGPMDRDPGFRRVDFVLGDRRGISCAPAITRLAKDTLTGMGYVVTLNSPYAGGFTTEHYGKPATGRHALQIEINRALYMNETNISRSDGMAALVANMESLIEALAAIDPEMLASP
ncbi:MAG: N-formylglutamate amidohydrolase [Rhodospirillaceae bacterium]|nr:N-formylglutamate amidohydrolase [Rhodospirillaceae bacterium]